MFHTTVDSNLIILLISSAIQLSHGSSVYPFSVSLEATNISGQFRETTDILGGGRAHLHADDGLHVRHEGGRDRRVEGREEEDGRKNGVVPSESGRDEVNRFLNRR